MSEHRHQYAIASMCRVLWVARAGFYQWLRKQISDREQENNPLLRLIRDSYTACRGCLRCAPSFWWPMISR